MMTKKIAVLALVMSLTVSLVLPAWADHFHNGYSKEGGYQCPVTEKFMMKAHFILENKDELGLTEDQIKKIKVLKHGVKKAYIRQTADMQILFIDVEDKMAEPTVDVEGIDALIDQGFTSLSTTTKSTVQAYADLKAVLTEEQMTKLKELWWKQKK